MQSLRLQNDALARMLHNQLYQRLTAFCAEYTPELPPSVVVNSWLSRLYTDDSNLHLLVTVDDDYSVVGHAVIDVQSVHSYKVVYCHQAQADKGYTSTLDIGVEYVDKLVAAVGAYCAVFTVTKHIKGLQKKYNYQLTRTMMVKYNGESGDINEQQ